MTSPEPSLADRRYGAIPGSAVFSGVQALVRLPLDQRRIDRTAGLDIAGFISGYEGSPLGGYDLEIQRNAARFEGAGIRHVPGVNEDLAATSVAATQYVPNLEGRTVDGVTGIWYGKAPGLDRSMDAIRHANLMGTHPRGGALAVVGDDPASKSSTVPSASESALMSLGVPVFQPADPGEALRFGLHGIAMSRASGLWVALKIVTAVADGHQTIDLPVHDEIASEFPRMAERTDVRVGIANDAVGRREMERSAYEERFALANEYLRLADLDQLVDPGSDSEIGIVSAGQTYLETTSALASLGLTHEMLDSWGVRRLKLASIYPIRRELIRRFAKGLKTIVVVEEKRPFVESAIKEALYGLPDAPEVLGKYDSDGLALVPVGANLTADRITEPLMRSLTRYGDVPNGDQRSSSRETISVSIGVDEPSVTRPNYPCSGCPHNRSLEVPDGARVGIGIGCHALVTQMPTERVGELVTKTHMGGEGAQWIGVAPFLDESNNHIFQNVGDGTFAHSGSLAIRAAVAAGIPITFKILHNAAVAMTGGQDVVGGLTVPQLTHLLAAEGVSRIAVFHGDDVSYRRKDLAPNTDLHRREDLITVQERLQQHVGVSVLIYDQECATELRRKRKRGSAPQPRTRVVIDERVCEGCGDCGYKSNCLSVEPIPTPLGRKTKINQTTCNFDYSCLDGDCPAFALVEIDEDEGELVTISARSSRPTAEQLASLPEPDRARAGATKIRFAGIGGTGIITMAHVLAEAAKSVSLHTRGLDMTGLAQKGGAVFSDLVISETPSPESGGIMAGEADLVLGCDLVVTAKEDTMRTIGESGQVVVSTSESPTGFMVVDPDAPPQNTPRMLDRLSSRTSIPVFSLDALALSEEFFGSSLYGNTILLGVAYQLGRLPMDAAAIESAYRTNGVDITKNIDAFRWGRLMVVDPELTEVSALEPPTEEWFDSELRAYQNRRYADRYHRAVREVARAERAKGLEEGSISDPFRRHLFKLMAYKDEYEVARLWLEPGAVGGFGKRGRHRKRTSIQLHPPVLRSMGMRRKISFGSWSIPILRLLKAARRLRGTRVDPFGFTHMRRMERALVTEYVEIVRSALNVATAANSDIVRSIIELPDVIRGYEGVKVRNVRRYNDEMDRLLSELGIERPGDRLSVQLTK